MDIITTHQNSDWDAIGSMILARKIYPDAALVLPDRMEKEVKEFADENLRNILHLRKPESIDPDTVKRLIIVDTQKPERIGILANLLKKPQIQVHIYDHHPSRPGDIDASLTIVRDVGSTVTIMVELLSSKNVQITSDEATWALLGLYQDTGNLTFRNTTSDDLLAAAWLLKQKANLDIVREAMSRGLDAEQIVVLHDMLQSVTRLHLHKNEILLTEVSVSHYIDSLAACVTRLRQIRGADAALALIVENAKIHLIARSNNPEIDVNSIVQAFGGGGHPEAASAIIRETTLVEIREKLLLLLPQLLGKQTTAHDLMITPALTLDCEQKVYEAKLFFLKTHFHAAPVLNKKGEVVGLLDNREITRAMHHGLDDHLLIELIDQEPISVSPDLPLSSLYELAVNHHQRLLPVIESGRLIGVVSRSDIFSALSRNKIADPDNDGRPGIKEGFASRREMANPLRQAIPAALSDMLQRLGGLAAEKKTPAYIVGGFVRDLILQRPNLDLDIVVEGDAIALAEELGKEFSAKVSVHKDFQTATIFLDKHNLDVATARREFYRQPAALPVVESSTIRSDLVRRDFTINTMLLRLDPDHFGELVDLYNGLDDIKRRSIRVLHSLSFIEDPTRIFRGIRLAKRLGFTFETHTLDLMRYAVDHDFPARLTGSRIWKEWTLISREKLCRSMIEELLKYKILPSINNNLQGSERVFDALDGMENTLNWYKLSYLERPIEENVLWLSTITAFLDDKKREEIAKRFEMEQNLASRFVSLPTNAHQLVGRLAKSATDNPSQQAQYIRGVAIETRLLSFALAKNEDVKRAISNFLIDWEKIEPQINGNDLKNLGIPPGPEYRRILDAVRDARLDKEVVTRSEELDLANRLAFAKNSHSD